MTKNIGCLVFILLLAQAAPVRAQGGADPMAAVKDRYATAAWDEAVGLLDQMKPAPGDTTLRVEIEKYRFLCLLALGRKAEAGQAVERLVALNPTFGVSQIDAAPWVRTAFTDARRRVLPEVVNNRYEEAKAAVLAKSYAEALPQLKQVLALLDDPDLATTEERWRKDLRTLAQSFLDLAQLAPPPPAPKPDAPSVAAPPAQPPASSVSPVVPAVALKEEIPAWPTGLRSAGEQEGLIRVIVDEKGAVTDASIVRSIHPVYDQLLLQAAKTSWQYKPATKDGTPITYTKLIRVVVNQRQ